ncbi:hypothetical protein JW824_04825 [bacterium]|nr:hypothetical protein [bacterium]RQV97079.1 MAG: hypothetical protein EH221_04250 [bacterium]
MKKMVIFLLLLSFIVPVLVRAQSEDRQSNILNNSQVFRKPAGFLDSLLDPSKFSMSHSYSLSYFSMGGNSFNQGLYLNTMNYQFSDPLFMQVRIGYVHQPFGMMDQSNGMNGKVFIQRAMIEYKPTENMKLTIDYQAHPNTMVLPFYNRW